MKIMRDDIVNWLEAYEAAIAENKELLTRLDAEIGDGDHGINMCRGFKAVKVKLSSVADLDIGLIFKTVGMTLISTVGGASGPLYGTFFLKMAATTKDKQELNFQDWIAALQAGLDGVIMRGKANPGDKTMIDSLSPALIALKMAQENDLDFWPALRSSAQAAEQGMLDTIPLVARKGRASYLGERSSGHQDPGATSAHLLLKTLSLICAGE